MSKNIYLLACLTFAAGLANAVMAGESSKKFDLRDHSLKDLLELTVTGATRTEQKSSLTPAVVSLIDAKDIQAFGYESVAEVLAHVAGFIETDDLVTHNFGVRGSNAGLRAGSRMIKVMIDDQPVAFRSTQQNFIGLELIPMKMIKRIEVVRGPVSALYGANAFAGIVNIVTYGGQYFDEVGSFASAAATYNEHAGMGQRFNLATGGVKNDWSYTFGASYAQDDRAGLALPRRSPLYDLFESGRNGRRLSMDEDESQPVSAYGRVQWSPNKQRSVTLSGHYQQIEADQSFNDLKPLRDSGVNHVAQAQGFLRLDWQDKLAKNIDLRTYAAYSQGEPLNDDRIEVGASSYYLEREFGYQAWDVGSELVWKPSARQSFLLGLDYSHETHDLEHFYQVERSTGQRLILNAPYEARFSNFGIYAQWQYQFKNRWLKTRWHSLLGYRFDQHSVTDAQSSLRMGFVGELPEGRVLKLLFGQAFQAPSAELLYRDAVLGGDIVGNPDLQYQKVNTLEASLLVPLNEHLHLTHTVFLTQTEDLVLYQSTQSNFIARNSTDSKTYGWEMELRYDYKDWRGYFNMLWQHTELDDNPYNLFVLNERSEGSLFPVWSANFGARYTWPKWKLHFSLDNRYVGSRSASTQNVNLAQRFYRLEPYVDTTLTLATKYWSLGKKDGTTIRLQVRDLWDSQYVNPGFGGIEIPSLGRRYLLSLEQVF